MLILAATPIGNLGDASPRLAQVLAKADHLFAEDTRQTAKLLRHLDIHRGSSAFHEHSGEPVLAIIRGHLAAGETVAYVSDAGMPGISDPGYELVRLALELDVPIDVIPGPSAVLNALILSGISPHQFCFLGFFPTKLENRKAMLDRLAILEMTAVFFEAPSRIRFTLEFLRDNLPDTQLALCRELTKLHQQVLRGTAADILAAMEVVKGEMVLVVAPVAAGELGSRSLEEEYRDLLAQGNSPAQSVRALAKTHRISKRELYQRLGLK